MSLLPNRRHPGWLSVAVVASLLIAGGWPFAVRPANRVDWLEGRSGLRFRPSGLVYDPQPRATVATDASGEAAAEFTIELWLAASLEPADDVHYILSLHGGRLPCEFLLCQWKSALVLRCRRFDEASGHRETGVRDALPPRKARLVTLVGDATGLSFYLDGVLAKRVPGFAVSPRALDGQLIIGDSAGGMHAWTGELYGLAIHKRALAAAEVASHHAAWTNRQAAVFSAVPGLDALYLFDEAGGEWVLDHSPGQHRLWIPPTYRVLHRTVLSLPWADGKLRRADLKDILINIAGFVPFGLLMGRSCRLRGSGWLRSLTSAMLAGGAVSLLIELVQVWLPGRVSSATDLCCNTLGAMLGALALPAVLAAARRGLSDSRIDGRPGAV